MIRIVTDTTSGVPEHLCRRYDISVIPQVIIFGEEQFLEMEEMDHAAFMARLTSNKTLPKTAAPAPEAFARVYRPFVEAGDTIFSIHPSTDVSGTVRGATVASEDFAGADIRILDTRSIAGPLARLVLFAAQAAEQGQDADRIMADLQRLMTRTRIYFLVDTLEYLVRGGRIGGAAGLVGGLLQVKPILVFQNGRVETFERQRTHKRALERLKELVVTEAARGEGARLSVMHVERPAQAESLATELQTALGAPDVLIMNMAPAIVTHVGPGALAVGFFTPEAS